MRFDQFVIMIGAEDKFLKSLNSKQPEAFKVLFREFYNTMISFSLNFIIEKEVAEDIVQELFANIWENNYQFYSLPSLKTFLYRSVKNAAINHLKHEKVKQRSMPLHVCEVYEEPDDFKMIEEEMYKILFEVIDSLPKRCKEIFELHLAGRKNEEIANLLNISILTVKTQKSRAMQILRTHMGELFSLALFLHII